MRWKLTEWMPGLKLLTQYNRADLPYDLTAGLVVVLVLIPSAIAYADLAKCPPVAGLYAALGGMVVFALFTSSKHVVTGPDAAVALLVGAAVGPLSNGDPGQALALSTWLALLAGLLLWLAAYFRLGAAADFLAHPVMLGFLNGAAVVIIGSQIGKLCGIKLVEENTLWRLWEWLTRLPETHPTTLGLGLSCIAILTFFRLKVAKIPGTVVVFLLALLAGQCIDFKAWGVSVIGAVDTKIPDPVPPALSLQEMGRLILGAAGLAMLIFPEGILLGRAMAGKHRYPLRADQELIALGAANIAAGLLRSYAVGASQSRTLLNDATGGRTPLVSLVAGVLLVLFMYFLATWIAALPNVAIAAILTFTGITLIDVAGVRKLRRMRRFDAQVSLLTSLGVIAFGVLPGIILGVFLSLLKVLSQVARPQDALLGRVPGSHTLHDVGDDEAAQTVPGLVVYRFYGPLVFANVRFFMERLEHFIGREKIPVRQVILDARAIPELDVTAAEELHAYFNSLQERGIRLLVSKSHLPLRQAAVSLGLEEWFGETNHVPHISDAVTEFERQATPA
jgi:SulP family sulfate permease